MAIPSEKAVSLEQDASAENFPEAMVDVEEMMSDDGDESLDTPVGNDRFASSAELRRKIEERQELKRLQDELGFGDDIDF